MENLSYAKQRIMDTASSFKKLYYIYKEGDSGSAFGEQML